MMSRLRYPAGMLALACAMGLLVSGSAAGAHGPTSDEAIAERAGLAPYFWLSQTPQ